MDKNCKILVTGGAGFLGSFVVKELQRRGYSNLVVPRSSKVDLRDFDSCKKITDGVDIVIHLAATVGGIGYNLSKPGELFYNNAVMGINMIESSRLNKVKKFVCIGTICAYPKFTPVPFKEERLWDGYPEETNAPYGIAKKVLLTQLQAYRVQYGFNGIFLLPVNLYGPGDNFNPEQSHVIPALIKKVHDAKKEGKTEISVWGDGTPTREFLYVKDAAKGIVDALENYDSPDPVNLGNGMEIPIKVLVERICKHMNFQGNIVWDSGKPNGQPKRCLDTSRAEKFGFKALTNFDEGLNETIKWFEENESRLR